MVSMEQWRMTEPKIEGTVKEWFKSAGGEYVGMIDGDDGGVYIANSKNCANGNQAPQIVVGSRVRFTPSKRGQGTDMDSKTNYSWGVAHEIALNP